MTLTEALDRLTEGMDFDVGDWRNPVRPMFISGLTQTPYEAYEQLKTEYKTLIINWVGHVPHKNEE